LNTVENIIYLDILNTVENIIYLDILNTVEKNPVIDPEFHTELIIKDEYEDVDSENMETSIITI